MAGAASKPRARVLVVEDEAPIRTGLCDLLAYHGHEPEPAADGEQGWVVGHSQRFDLAILDVMLPGLDGFELCRRLREHDPLLPIMMLTAKGAEDDIVTGLEAGADDYLTKPFSVRELAARVAALLRRNRKTQPDDEVFRCGRWRIDPARLCARARGREVELTPRELALLRVFVRERGRIVSRRALLQDVWDMPHPEQIETRTVDVHIGKLRKKLDATGDELIETVRGAGYRLVG